MCHMDMSSSVLGSFLYIKFGWHNLSINDFWASLHNSPITANSSKWRKHFCCYYRCEPDSRKEGILSISVKYDMGLAGLFKHWKHKYSLKTPIFPGNTYIHYKHHIHWKCPYLLKIPIFTRNTYIHWKHLYSLKTPIFNYLTGNESWAICPFLLVNIRVTWPWLG